MKGAKFQQYQHFAAELDNTAGIDGNGEQIVDSPADTHRNAPRPDAACLYGLVRDVALAGSNNTEANPYAIAGAMLAYLGAAVGRGPYLSIGDDSNHARLFFVHVGRSSRGRKGTAKKLIYRINEAVKVQNERLAPQIHRGGLSTREGLALMIHDGYKDGKNEVPPIVDKRLFVVESEFANILHQSKRDGNTLSAALRDAWDGTSIRPAVKTCRVWASDPHIGIVGDVTPSELRELMHTRELTNGFANRFVFFWAEGEKVLPFPKQTPQTVVDRLAARVAQVLQFAGADRHEDKDAMRMELSAKAALLYEQLYLGELRDCSAGENINALLARRAPVLLRLAMLFALTDLSTVIDVAHINAAMAWVRYWNESIKFVFQNALDEANAADITETAQKIVSYLTEKGQSTRTEISRGCFKGHVSKDKLDEALDVLLTTCPPTIEVEVVPRTNGQSGSASKLYKICLPVTNRLNMQIVVQDADSAECAKQEVQSVSNILPSMLRSQRNVDAAQLNGASEFAQIAASADASNAGPSLMEHHTLQNSQISPELDGHTHTNMTG